jgi:carnosine N-methyltransferase
VLQVESQPQLILTSFSQYAKVAHFNTTHLRRQSFYALPREHLQLLSSPPFSYLETLNSVDDAIDRNAGLSTAILQAGLASFGVAAGSKEWRGKATSSDLEKARSTLRQFFRDWSEEGANEREACNDPVIKALQHEQSLQPDLSMRVLVPGAGLGRLVFDLCAAGFDTEGNEISYHQLLASAYILNVCPTSRMHTLFPWVHSFSNHRSRPNHLRSVQVPDIHPSTTLGALEKPGEMSFSASDFLLLYGSEEHKHTFDAVATVFFLDTAPNVIRYLETIDNCLRPGGILVNFGPLLWHFENDAPGSQRRGKDFGSKQKSTGKTGFVTS